MATSRSGAGGKIVTNRRKQRLSATPYYRPPPPASPAPVPNRTNWFTGLIIPSARAIASGAGKIVSSIFSESESSSDEDSVSDDDDGHDNEYENPYGQKTQLGVQRTETKHIIEQLIMQETFSREECDSLVKVLNSRVMEQPMGVGEISVLAGSPETSDDHGDADIYNKALLEAKKWFQNKKVGSSSRTELVQRSFNTNSTGLQHVQGVGGSPVDVARSYMKDRPPWASPTKNIELGTPSTTTMKLFNEGTMSSVGHDSLSLSKKRNSLASGSWNIQEELRRVRLKATEDMLRTPPSKIDSSWFAAATTRWDSAGASKVVSVVGEKTSGPESFRSSKHINALVDAGVNYDPALPAVESRQDGKPSETSPSKPATSVSGNNETSEAAVQMDERAAPNASHPSSPTHVEEQHTVPQASQPKLPNGSSATEGAEHGAKQIANGPLSSQESLSAGVATVEKLEQHGENNGNGDSITENKSENPTEAYVEVPIVTETTAITSGSMDVQSEEVSVDVGQPSKKEKAPETVAGKQQGRKASKVSRRGRGRGK